MSEHPQTTTVEALLDDMSWVRGLARRLVGDPSAADDVVQETWIAALDYSRSGERPSRPWLARVARSFARGDWRGRTRRKRREEQAHVVRDLPSPDELVEEMETQRLLAAAVVRLPEPYRATVILRYSKGLTAAEIARREGVPAATVRGHLRRGIELLREDLVRSHGRDWEAWQKALLPLAGLSESGAKVATAGTVAGGLLMGARLEWAVGLLLLLGAFWVWNGRGSVAGQALAPGAENAQLEAVPLDIERPATDAGTVAEADTRLAVESEQRFVVKGRIVFPAEMTAHLVDVDGKVLWHVDFTLRDEGGDRHYPRFGPWSGDGQDYEFAGLSAGEVTLVCEVEPGDDAPEGDHGCLREEVTLVLEEEEVVWHDILLEAKPVLDVTVTMADGSSPFVGMGLSSLPGERGLHVVATRERLPQFFPGADPLELGIAHYDGPTRNSKNRRPPVNRPYRLVFEERLPAWVSVTLHQGVVATKPVSPGTESIEFVLTSDELEAVFASLEARFVAAEDGRPLAGNVSRHYSSSSVYHNDIGRDGTVTLTRLTPGEHVLRYEAAGRELYRGVFHLEPGEHRDLGEIALATTNPIIVTAVGPDGEPARWFRPHYGRIDRGTVEWSKAFEEDSRTNDQGELMLGNLARGEYLVRLERERDGSSHEGMGSRGYVVDVRQGSAPVSIVLEPLTPVYLPPRGERTVLCEIAGPGGFVIHDLELGEEQTIVELVRDRHEFVYRDAEGTVTESYELAVRAPEHRLRYVR